MGADSAGFEVFEAALAFGEEGSDFAERGTGRDWGEGKGGYE